MITACCDLNAAGSLQCCHLDVLYYTCSVAWGLELLE